MVEVNAQQRTYWNEGSGLKWVEMADVLNEQIEPLGFAAMDVAGVPPGHHVLDIGCGCGQTSLELAHRVGVEGRVQGVDISAPMLADARERGTRSGVGVDFVEADAQVYSFERGVFDLVFSRFGVMFFENPVAAFTNIRRALKPNGALSFICWQSITCNPWMLVPALAAAQHVEPPGPASPDAPGPFAFADADRIVSTLQQAGWSDVHYEDHSGELSVGLGRSLSDIIDFLQQIGLAGTALREATPQLRTKVSETMNDVLAPYYTGRELRMGFATWIVSATSPA